VTAESSGAEPRRAPLHPRLRAVIDELGPDRWAAFVLDAEFRLAWVSDELKAFLHQPDDATLRVGEHILTAWLDPVWVDALTPESGALLFETILRQLRWHGIPEETLHQLAAGTAPLITAVTTGPPPPLWTAAVDFVEQPGLPPYRVEFVTVVLREEDGTLIGGVVLTNIGVRPTLLARLGRGDESMYARMARVAEPARHATAILFADLEASAQLSRMLPTAAYFQLIRELTAGFDDVVASSGGIVGKHAGDGWTAFFLADDAGGPSGAVAGAIRTARAVQQQAAALRLPEALAARVNVGVHWGPGVYLGQVVPGGRLDVTALGDEVNECARVAECARGGAVLVSKEAVELLDHAALQDLRIDAQRLLYTPLTSMPAAGEKTRRDAATLAVVSLD